MKKLIKLIFWYNFCLQIFIIKLIKKPKIFLIVGGTKKSSIRNKLVELADKKGLDYNRYFYPYNTWFGVVLDFLGIKSAFSDYKKWILIYFYSWIKFFKHLIYFPKIIFLEGGIDEYGEADKFIFALRPEYIWFVSPDMIFQDDFDVKNIVEKEFLKFVEYLNYKSKDLLLINEEVNIEKLFDKYLLKNEKYIGFFEEKDNNLRFLYDKLSRKVKVKLDYI